MSVEYRTSQTGRVVRLDTLEFDSHVLRGNPLSDPTRRVLPVIRPICGGAHESFPTILWLAGFGSTGETLLQRAALAEPLFDRIDRLINKGVLPPVVVAFPDCSTRYGGSQYIDSTGTGAYQTYLVDEVLPLLAEKFGASTTPRRRAVIGRSSGGFGALRMALDRPDVIGSVGCLAPDVGFEYCYWPFIPAACDFINRHGGLAAIANSPSALEPKDSKFMLGMSLIANGACYSPNEASPFGFDFPNEPSTGVIRYRVWQRWLAHDPARLAPRRARTLRELSLLYIDVGSSDEYNMQWGARAFNAVLDRNSVRHVFEEHVGTHRGGEHRFDLMLAKVGRAWRSA